MRIRLILLWILLCGFYTSDFSIVDLDFGSLNRPLYSSDNLIIYDLDSQSIFLLNNLLNPINNISVGISKGEFDSYDNYIVGVFDNSLKWINKNGTVMQEFESSYGDVKCIDFDKDSETECLIRDYNGMFHVYNKNEKEWSINVSDGEYLKGIFGRRLDYNLITIKKEIRAISPTMIIIVKCAKINFKINLVKIF